MLAYIIRRLAYFIPILLGVNILIFVLFFFVNTPDDMAETALGGEKYATPEQIENWKRQHNYHLPRFYNTDSSFPGTFTQTIFWQKSLQLFVFRFGKSDMDDTDIGKDLATRIPYSLCITVPTFLMTLSINLVLAMLVAFYRGTYVDTVALFVCVIMMSISALFYIIGGQYLVATHLKLTPVSGFDPSIRYSIKFLILPVVIGVVGGIGGGVRYYRTIFLEEINKDYVRTARAKGLGEGTVLFRHALKNAMVPILTNVVVQIPFLIMGSLLLEKFFGIPGLGSYTIDAIAKLDFAVIRSMVFLGSVLYVAGLIGVDISYTFVETQDSFRMNDASKTLLTSWSVQNLVVAGLVALLVWIGFNLARREYWRVAFREVFRRRLVRLCFGILCVYALIALIDSVGYHPALRDAAGAVQRSPETGRVLRDPDGLSLLDVALTGLRQSREKTYSAPFAKVQFTKEVIVTEAGEVTRGYPALQHPGRHVLGTTRVGTDVLYVALKSVRTGMVIGAFTTLLVIPFAIFFGVVAGYFGGWIDDAIQYIYTVLSSIPSVLLIVAFMVIVDTKFPQLSRLFALCIIMGITSWTGLCRVLRGETLKLRESEFIQACQAMGVPRLKIIYRHLVPNVMHIVLITAVLSFSGRVLAEAVLTYIGIGVGADTYSWGMMINNARLELARDPAVWWNLFAAFIFMLGLVLPANLFGDALRDALDPRLRTQ